MLGYLPKSYGSHESSPLVLALIKDGAGNQKEHEHDAPYELDNIICISYGVYDLS